MELPIPFGHDATCRGCCCGKLCSTKAVAAISIDQCCYNKDNKDNNMIAFSFEKLDAYVYARELVKEIYELQKKFPKEYEELLLLFDQHKLGKAPKYSVFKSQRFEASGFSGQTRTAYLPLKVNSSFLKPNHSLCVYCISVLL